MWAIALSWIVQILPVVPSLVTDIENLWRHKPKSGAQKWISVEQALSGSISEVTAAITAAAPAGTKAEDISAAISIFVRAVNDASVALANSLGAFPHSAPAPAPGPAPKA